MLAPAIIKEEIEHTLPLFFPGEEELLFDIIRRKAKYYLHFFVGQRSEHWQKFFKDKDLSFEASAFVKELFLFIDYQGKYQDKDFRSIMIRKDNLVEFRLRALTRIGQCEALADSNFIDANSTQWVLSG